MASRNPYRGRAADPLAKLERCAADDTRAMLAAIRRNIVRLRGVVAGAKNPQQLRARDKLYREVYAAYAELGQKINAILKGGAANAAMLSAQAVLGSLAESGRDLFQFSMERAKRYWRYICPENGRSLAATMTDKMSEDLVETLRRATVEIERQAAVEGWTMDEIRKAIEDRWAEISKDGRNFKFVDKSGRAWENGRYCQMLARTTATRVYNDSFLDRLAEEGFNLVKVSSHGSEPDCDVCRAWSGVICAISGKSDKYPTVEEARQAGVFHPNCMCTWEYVDEDEDRAEIERQGKAGKVDWNDLKAVERRNGGGGEGRDGDADASNDAGRLAPAKDPEPFSLDKSLEPSPELVRFMGKAGVARQKEPLDLSVTNPGFGEEFGRHDNCTHCVVAGFLRLHGYDVIATPTGVGESYNAASYWKNAQKSELSLETLSADINEKMQEMGDGTIAMVRIPTSAKSTNGHVFLAMNSENGVFFYDCQTGNSGNCDVTIANAPLGSISHAWIMRIDNDVLTEQAMQCFTRNPNPGGTSSGQES